MRDPDPECEVDRRVRREGVEALAEARRDTLAALEAVPERIAMADNGSHPGDMRSEISGDRIPTRATGESLRHVRDDHRPAGRAAEHPEHVEPSGVAAPARPQVDATAGGEPRGNVGRGYGAEQVSRDGGEEEAGESHGEPG